MNSTTDFTNKQDFTSDEFMRKNLDIIIDPKFKDNISDWIYYAKPNEKKGLYILSKVIKHKGQKLFKTQMIKSKEEENDLSKLSLEEAYKRYQKKKNVSSYSEFYGGNLDDKYRYNNILKYKDFANLNYADYVNKDVHAYIQAWISIEKSEQYKEYVLDFLRSFLSTIRSNRKFVTIYKDQLPNFKRTDKFSAHAPYVQSKTEIKLNERMPTLEEMRARLKLDSYRQSEELISNNSISNQEEVAKRKLELMGGNKGLLKGIYNNTSSSCYQETFKGMPSKYPNVVKMESNSSAVKGISPDPFTMTRLKSTMEINDSLKNTVQTIMFSDNLNNYSKYR